MAKTNTGLVAHAQAQLGLPYIYGTYGKILTADIVNQKAKQYPSQMYKSRVDYALKHHLGKRSYDCAGLVKSYMFQETPTSAPKYDTKYDKSAGGLKSSCSETGKISTIPEIPGLLVFIGTSHVGIYAGNGYVIEAKGFDYGVVKTKLSAGKWDTWGKLSWITYPTRVQTPVIKETKQETIKTTPIKEGMFVTEKVFKNTSGKTLKVYADSSLKVEVGSIPAGNTCRCLGIELGRAIVHYKVIATGAYKVGYVNYTKGVQQ